MDILSGADDTVFSLGDLRVHRLGFGAMRLTGKGVWGPPADRQECVAVLRRAVELGVDLIDTAESYGPYVSEELIAEALHPYPKGLVIATKGGFDRPGPGDWKVNCRPERLREELYGSLRRLRLERIERARTYFPVVSVQNRYNLGDREWEPVLDYCEREKIGFIPWFPLNVGKLPVEPAKALAWLLKRSPVILPIPGTSKVKHLEENMRAREIKLSDEDFELLGQRGA